MSRLPGGNNHGFTMIEVIAVLLILGFLTFTAVSMLYQPDKVEVPTQIEVLKSHIRFAQAAALNSSNDWGIEVDTITSTTYVLFKILDDTSQDKTFPGEQSETVTLPAGFTLTSPASGNVLIFDTWGVPYVGTSRTKPDSPASTDLVFTLSKGAESKTATITKNTGYVP
ncbi:MAG TPA: type II secretion system protein [Syntrophales bacterium]|nr:type II secretion system protein [Syntrophales bacterium]HOX94904.1 type II secretion system protein [Syntrophales bacterium]HPI56382.1 type II secretion system protein [Syntrophales bacterium]HPN24230.1 type II secretion system protein [Syntrophales bacterium]HQM28583.1 type II secretion system protein [Syntrophales bacterium]